MLSRAIKVGGENAKFQRKGLKTKYSQIRGWYFRGRDSLTCAVEPKEFLLVCVANQQQTGKIT